MSNLPNYWEGKPRISAGEEMQRNRAIREGQLTGGPGVLVSRTGNGSTITFNPPPVPRADGPQMALATGTGSTTISGGTTIPLSAVESTFNGRAEDYLVSLASNVLTFRRPGVYAVDSNLTVGYQSATGTAGETMKEAKVMSYFDLGGVSATESQGFNTLSSRPNLTNKITGPVEDTGIVFYQGDSVSETAEPDTDPLADWKGDVENNGKFLTWATEVPSPGAGTNNLIDHAAPILTNMEKIAEYASSLFAAATIPSKSMVRVVLDTTSNSLKILRAGSYYPATLTLKASVTYGGEGDVDPTAVATAATVTVVRVCPVLQVVTL